MARLMKLTCEECKAEFERKAYPSWVLRGYYKFCSRSCAAKTQWTTQKSGKKNSTRKCIRVPGHPLASPKDGRILEYRYILYEAIGPGVHKCHWCPNEVEWVLRVGSGSSVGELVVDHLDGDMHNNSPENLVVSCNNYNTLRGLMMSWMERTGLEINELFD